MEKTRFDELQTLWGKLVADYAGKTGRRYRSAEKKLLHQGATKKRTASLKVVR